MEKWIWYVVGAFVAYLLFKKLNWTRGELPLAGGNNAGLTGGNNAGFNGWGNNLPPGINQQQAYGAYGGYPTTIGQPYGNTSVSQDVLNYSQAGVGFLGALGNFINGWGSSSGSSSGGSYGGGGGGSYGDPTYGNDPVMVP